MVVGGTTNDFVMSSLRRSVQGVGRPSPSIAADPSAFAPLVAAVEKTIR